MNDIAPKSPRSYRLTESQIEAIAERGATKALEHFGVFSRKDAAELAVDWVNMKKFMALYDGASKAVGRWVLSVILISATAMIGLVAAMKTGFIK